MARAMAKHWPLPKSLYPCGRHWGQVLHPIFLIHPALAKKGFLLRVEIPCKIPAPGVPHRVDCRRGHLLDLALAIPGGHKSKRNPFA